jgi:hypothetical protein
MKRILLFIILTACLLASFPAGCQEGRQTYTNPEWKPAEVRLIDEIDSSKPSLELVALYTRQSGEEFQVRLDFLDLGEVAEGNLYLAFDHKPGGFDLPGKITHLPVAVTEQSPWDTIILIEESGEIQSYQVNQDRTPGWQPLVDPAIRVVRNSQVDSIEISLHRSSLEPFVPNSRILAWVTFRDSSVMMDKAGPVLWNAAAPRPLPIVFAFNHVFPAYTPSQGLRRWDGAHTGPEGGRHGLYNLLRPARNARLPLLLLDLASPNSLAASDYQGGLELVRSLAQDDLVELASPLPESKLTLPEPVNQHFLDENTNAQSRYDLPVSTVIYKPILNETAESAGVLLDTVYSDRDPQIHEFQVLWKNGKPLIQLPAYPSAEDPQQASISGLTLPWKELLAQAALQVNLGTDKGKDRSYLVLGGSLPQSTWGQPASARAGIDYVYAHPWLSVTSPNDLLPGSILKIAAWSLPVSFSDVELAPDDLLADLLSAPQNSASQSAWQAYRALFSPIFPPSPQLPLLRQKYLGEISTLLKGSQWMADRKPIADCSIDVDSDGQVECILSDDRIMALFELDGGMLSHLFLSCPDKTSGKTLQVLGPSSQLITGLSDPMDWNLSQVESDPLPADPSVLPGAFAGPDGVYQPDVSANQLEQVSPDGQISKRFQLSPHGLHVEIRSQFPAQLPGQMVVPVLIEPARSLLPGGLEQYQSQQSPNEISWRIDDHVQLVLHTINGFDVTSFLDSRNFLGRTEDPNYAYPQGHYLPYPLMLVQIKPESTLFLDFQLRCE